MGVVNFQTEVLEEEPADKNAIGGARERNSRPAAAIVDHAERSQGEGRKAQEGMGGEGRGRRARRKIRPARPAAGSCARRRIQDDASSGANERSARCSSAYLPGDGDPGFASAPGLGYDLGLADAYWLPRPRCDITANVLALLATNRRLCRCASCAGRWCESRPRRRKISLHKPRRDPSPTKGLRTGVKDYSLGGVGGAVRIGCAASMRCGVSQRRARWPSATDGSLSFLANLATAGLGSTRAERRGSWCPQATGCRPVAA